MGTELSDIFNLNELHNDESVIQESLNNMNLKTTGNVNRVRSIREKLSQLLHKERENDVSASPTRSRRSWSLKHRVFSELNENSLNRNNNIIDKTKKDSSQNKLEIDHWDSDEFNKNASKSFLKGLHFLHRHVSSDSVGDNDCVSSTPKNYFTEMKDKLHGLIPKQKVQDTEAIDENGCDDNAEWNPDLFDPVSNIEKDKATLKDELEPRPNSEEGTTFELASSDSYIEKQKIEGTIPPATPPENEYIDSERNPYKFVFDTPNKFSYDDSQGLEPRALNNFNALWSLLVTDPERDQKLENGIMITKMSEILLFMARRKQNIFDADVNDYKEKLLELQEEVAAQKQSNDMLVRKVNSLSEESRFKGAYENLKEQYSILEIEKKTLEERTNSMQTKLDDLLELTIEQKTFETKYQKLQEFEEQANKNLHSKLKIAHEKYKNLKKKANSLSEDILYLKDELAVSNIFKEGSLNFASELMRKFNGLVQEKTLIKYNVALKRLISTVSIINKRSINSDLKSQPLDRQTLSSQSNELRSQLSSFFSETANNLLINEIVLNWSLSIRSNDFLKHQLVELRRQNFNQSRKIKKLTSELKKTAPTKPQSSKTQERGTPFDIAGESTEIDISHPQVSKKNNNDILITALDY